MWIWTNNTCHRLKLPAITLLTKILIIFLYLNLSFFPKMNKGMERIVYQSIFDGCIGILFYCLWKVWSVHGGKVPRDWLQSHAESAELKDMRECTKCDAMKPPRTHHCRLCNECILRMDHQYDLFRGACFFSFVHCCSSFSCPFTDSCIGFFNYKYYLLSLFWGLSANTVALFVLFWPVWATVTTVKR